MRGKQTWGSHWPKASSYVTRKKRCWFIGFRWQSDEKWTKIKTETISLLCTLQPETEKKLGLQHIIWSAGTSRDDKSRCKCSCQFSCLFSDFSSSLQSYFDQHVSTPWQHKITVLYSHAYTLYTLMHACIASSGHSLVFLCYIWKLLWWSRSLVSLRQGAFCHHFLC